MYIEKGKTECWPWQGADAPYAKVKHACDNPLCCNPRHIIEEISSIGDDDVEVIKEKEPEKKPVIKKKRGRPFASK